MKKYIGIDLHSNNSVVVVTDEEDWILYQKRLANKLNEILTALAPHRDETVGVVVESAYNWYWLIDGLMDAGYQAHLAHPSAMKKYEGLKYSGDFADAAYLAQMLRLGLLPEGHIFPRELRATRDLARKRMQLVRCCTMPILSIENTLARETGGRMDKRQIKRMTTEGIEALGLKSDVTLAMESNRVVCQALQQQIAALEKRLEAQVKLQPGYQLVKAIPGIGQILATTIMLETGTISRFADVGNFSSYCRCVDSLHESNGKKKGSGNTKNGNKYLAWAFLEAANFALRFCPEAKRFYERKSYQSRRGAQVCCAQTGAGMLLHSARAAAFRCEEMFCLEFGQGR